MPKTICLVDVAKVSPSEKVTAFSEKLPSWSHIPEKMTWPRFDSHDIETTLPWLLMIPIFWKLFWTFSSIFVSELNTWWFFQRVKNPWLVGGIPTPLKNMSSSDGIIIPNIWKVIKFMFQSPPLWLFNIANWKMAHLQMIFPARNQIPSGKLTVHYGKSPIFMGNLTISMAMFNSKLSIYQRVNPIKLPVNPTKSHFNHH